MADGARLDRRLFWDIEASSLLASRRFYLRVGADAKIIMTGSEGVM
jgi:hypothetical protein